MIIILLFFLSSSLIYSLKVYFSFSEAMNDKLRLNYFFDYLFPILSPFEEKTVYIDIFGNVIKTGGGLYDGHISSSVLKMGDFFEVLFSVFFNDFNFFLIDSLNSFFLGNLLKVPIFLFLKCFLQI